MSLICSDAFRVPDAPGLNVTAIVHPVPAAKGEDFRQSSCSLKSTVFAPVKAMLEIATGAVAVLAIVTVVEALGVPTG